MTIKVSSFFRGRYTFQQVAKLVLPELVSYERKRTKKSLRFWSTACTRGEEPYSIAIMLAEFLGYRLQDFNISIYATDISRHSLQEAHLGQYSLKDLETIPSAILKNYFNRKGGNYVIGSNIRRMVNFSYFDLVSSKTSPFMDLDCIFCCNVLIYLQKQLQDRVLNMLYNSLAAPGYLILGEVETLSDSLCGKLECLDATAKIYKKGGNHV
jgi:chemotaxis methyl-accepting protein methylase